MQCTVCDAKNPPDGLFCIECGAAMRAVASGATTRLPDGAGMICEACAAINPNHATFCVNCGRPLVLQDRVVTMPAAPQLVIPESNELARLPHTEPKQRRRNKRKQRRRNQQIEGGIVGSAFLIGLGVLFATGSFWPGILVLCGITGAIGSVLNDEPRAGLFALFWMVGMAVLFATGWFWPGILVLMGIAALFAPLLKK